MTASKGGVFVRWRAAILIVVGVLVAVLAGFWRLNQLQRDYTHRIAVVQCEGGNDYRRNDKARWDFLLSAIPPPDTAQGRDIRDRFVAYNERTDRLRDCTKIA